MNIVRESLNEFKKFNQTEIVSFEKFINGNQVVRNVPYKIKAYKSVFSKEKNKYLSHEVLHELAVIFEYMNQNDLTEIDFMDFIKNKMNSNNSSLEKWETKSISLIKTNNDYLNNTATSVDMSAVPKEDRKKVTNYVIKEWLEPYYELERRIRLDHPEKEELESQLKYFHFKLEKLPETHQTIIYMKYLDIDEYKKFQLDDFIISAMNTNRSYYYRYKREALYWLGLSLLEDK